MSAIYGRVNIYSYSMQCDQTGIEKIEDRLCRVLYFPRWPDDDMYTKSVPRNVREACRTGKKFVKVEE